MKYKIILILLAISIIISGCGMRQSTSVLPTDSPLTPEPSQGAITITPSLTPNYPTATNSPSPTASDTPIPRPTDTEAAQIEDPLKTQCLEVTADFPMGALSEGVIFLDSAVIMPNGRLSPDSYSINMGTGELKKITALNERLIYFAESPDKSLIAFSSAILNEDKITDRNLVILSPDGNIHKKYHWEKEWVDLRGWAGNHYILLELDQPSTPSSSVKPNSLVALDIQTGEKTILEPDYPDYYDFPPMPYQLGWEVPAYDATLKRVVYGSWIINMQIYGLTLWDNELQRPLATIPVGLFPEPVWSPDNTRFITVGLGDDRKIPFEMFSVSWDGQIDQLTDLGTAFPNVSFYGYKWSPDGRYIAMWLRLLHATYEEEVVQLAVLDTVTKEITNYCIPGDVVKSEMSPATPPVWSPDGKQLVVGTPSSGENVKVILIDIEQGYAVQIGEDMLPQGWLANP